MKSFLDDIKKVARELGKETITTDEYLNNGGKYHCSSISRRFGGWIKALQQCGLNPNKNQLNPTLANYTKPYITTEELIDDLQRVSTVLRKNSFSSGEYTQHGKYSKDTYFKRFKTWENSLIAANLTPYKKVSEKRINEYDVLKEIERIWIKLGRQPTTTDIFVDGLRQTIPAWSYI